MNDESKELPLTPALSPEGRGGDGGERPALSPAAQRALAEAEARRKAIDEKAAAARAEKGGRGGLEPGRYGDWEIKGLTADF